MPGRAEASEPARIRLGDELGLEAERREGGGSGEGGPRGARETGGRPRCVVRRAGIAGDSRAARPCVWAVVGGVTASGVGDRDRISSLFDRKFHVRKDRIQLFQL